MGKHIYQEKPHSRNNLYVYEGSTIEKLPYFLYEVSINKYWKNGYSQIKSRFFKSNKFIRFRKAVKRNNTVIEKEITLLGAPESFIKEYNLSIYQPKKKKKK